MSKIVFDIYIAGLTSRSRELIQAYSKICSDFLDSENYDIGIIDISKKPKEAEWNKILATPTIIRRCPSPEKRVIGDFRDNSKAHQAFEFLTEDIINKYSWKKGGK